jgi:hypothetical protein
MRNARSIALYRLFLPSGLSELLSVLISSCTELYSKVPNRIASDHLGDQVLHKRISGASLRLVPYFTFV